MTAYSQPITPFHVNAVYLKTPPESQARKQNGQGGNNDSSGGGSQFFSNGDFGWLHLAALLVFAAVYWLVQRSPALSGIAFVVLFPCLMFRLHPFRRRIP